MWKNLLNEIAQEKYFKNVSFKALLLSQIKGQTSNLMYMEGKGFRLRRINYVNLGGLQKQSLLANMSLLVFIAAI